MRFGWSCGRCSCGIVLCVCLTGHHASQHRWHDGHGSDSGRGSDDDEMEPAGEQREPQRRSDLASWVSDGHCIRCRKRQHLPERRVVCDELDGTGVDPAREHSGADDRVVVELDCGRRSSGFPSGAVVGSMASVFIVYVVMPARSPMIGRACVLRVVCAV